MQIDFVQSILNHADSGADLLVGDSLHQAPYRPVFNSLLNFFFFLNPFLVKVKHFSLPMNILNDCNPLLEAVGVDVGWGFVT